MTIALLAALIALPALDAVCLAACEPGTAGTEAALASHHESADCHDMASSEARVESGASLACGDYRQAFSGADAVLTPSRDTAAPRPAAHRLSTSMELTGALSPAWSRPRVATSPPGVSRAPLSVVLRI